MMRDALPHQDRLRTRHALRRFSLGVALVVVLVVVLVTEFASNVAAASAFMPVVAAVAVETGAAPLPLVMAAAIPSARASR